MRPFMSKLSVHTQGRPVRAAPLRADLNSSMENIVSIHSTSAPPAFSAAACSANISHALVKGERAQRLGTARPSDRSSRRPQPGGQPRPPRGAPMRAAALIGGVDAILQPGEVSAAPAFPRRSSSGLISAPAATKARLRL